MSRGISGDKQVIAFASSSYPVEVFLYSHKTRRRFNSHARSGVLFESRYVKKIVRCVKLIRCPIWLHPMLPNGNRHVIMLAGNLNKQQESV